MSYAIQVYERIIISDKIHIDTKGKLIVDDMPAREVVSKQEMFLCVDIEIIMIAKQDYEFSCLDLFYRFYLPGLLSTKT